jgi:hypothetical protein
MSKNNEPLDPRMLEFVREMAAAKARRDDRARKRGEGVPTDKLADKIEAIASEKKMVEKEVLRPMEELLSAAQLALPKGMITAEDVASIRAKIAEIKDALTWLDQQHQDATAELHESFLHDVNQLHELIHRDMAEGDHGLKNWLRSQIEQVVIHPTPRRAPYKITVSGKSGVQTFEVPIGKRKRKGKTPRP